MALTPEDIRAIAMVVKDHLVHEGRDHVRETQDNPWGPPPAPPAGKLNRSYGDALPPAPSPSGRDSAEYRWATAPTPAPITQIYVLLEVSMRVVGRGGTELDKNHVPVLRSALPRGAALFSGLDQPRATQAHTRVAGVFTTYDLATEYANDHPNSAGGHFDIIGPLTLDPATARVDRTLRCRECSAECGPSLLCENCRLARERMLRERDAPVLADAEAEKSKHRPIPPGQSFANPNLQRPKYRPGQVKIGG